MNRDPGSRVAGIVLAAGRSSRMAPRNKLVELIEGEPVVRRVAAVAVTSDASPIVVVTGHDAAAVENALRGLDVTITFNPGYGDGLSASLRAGLRALPPNVDGALVLLGDMPNVEAATLRSLIAVFTGAEAICVPVHQGRRGNPVLWGSRWFAEMMEISGDIGAKSLMARHNARVIEVEVATNSIFADVDTPADFALITPSGGAG